MPTSDLDYTTFETPLGRLSVAYRGPTACYSDLDVDDAAFEAGCQAVRGVRPSRAAGPPPAALANAVRDFFEGSEGRYAGPVDLTLLSELQQRALRKVMELPRGQVRTYGWIAREIGAPQAARAVGTAMARNPVPILVPCHRAIRNDFIPRTYGCGGPAKKAAILALEGVDLPSLQRQASRRGASRAGTGR
ncbi:MAG TPA: methylated-DNA--[protein]-cysteine S-methyltransferase [Chloroflexota bacterium]|nr:methylated-DNA--[protein]-cysteine S-methyltransferase [Chloroflexota bacterium]